MKSSFLTAERIMSLVAAAILLQTLYFKFSAHPDSVFIFSQHGLEPYGRIGLGIIELITGILLMFRRTSLFGAILGLGIILGAIFSHLFEVQNDGGKLFLLALVVFIACGLSLFFQKKELKVLFTKITGV